MDTSKKVLLFIISLPIAYIFLILLGWGISSIYPILECNLDHILTSCSFVGLMVIMLLFTLVTFFTMIGMCILYFVDKTSKSEEKEPLIIINISE